MALYSLHVSINEESYVIMVTTLDYAGSNQELPVILRYDRCKSNILFEQRVLFVKDVLDQMGNQAFLSGKVKARLQSFCFLWRLVHRLISASIGL